MPLIYEMNRYHLNEQGVKCVCDGARSITEHSNIQPFLMDKFHFRKAYCQLEVVYKWYVDIIVVMLYPKKKVDYTSWHNGFAEPRGDGSKRTLKIIII